MSPCVVFAAPKGNGLIVGGCGRRRKAGGWRLEDNTSKAGSVTVQNVKQVTCASSHGCSSISIDWRYIRAITRDDTISNYQLV